MSITLTQIFLAGAFACATLAGSVEAQVLDKPISLSIDNAEIRFVLQQIQKQVDVKFIYSPTAIQATRKTSIHVSNKKLGEILDLIFPPLQIQYKVRNDRILLFRSDQAMGPEPLFQQEPAGIRPPEAMQLVVSGKVTNTKNEGIPGASVLIKGTTMGTTTSNEGKYSLTVPDEHGNGTLIFSFIGYKTVEIPLRNQSALDVKLMEDVSQLSEVVVNGYQQIRKESFTGTAITVTGAQLKTINPLNILQSVQAFDPSFRVAQDNTFGSNPNKLPNITVRGATGLPANGTTQTSANGSLSKNTLNSNNPNLPTFILNGFEVSLQTVYDLDINKVESITLLKDAAATAVYGSRAANGVLVIKTKKPVEGRLQFYYSGDYTVTGPDLTVYHLLNAQDKLEYERLANVYNSTVLNNGETQDNLDINYYHKKRNVVGGVNTYWLSEPVKTAFGQNHSLGVQGGSASFQYGITARYQGLKGVMKGSDRSRYGIDINLNYNLNDKFQFSNMLTVSEVKSQESPYGSFEGFVKMNPYYPKRDSGGNVVQAVDSWKRREVVGQNGNGEIKTDYVLNPSYNATLSSFDKNAYTQIIDALSVNWRIVPGLNLRGLMSITKTRTAGDKFKSPFSNEYFDKTGDDLKKRGEYDYTANDETTLDGNLVLSYNTTFHNHFLNASLGTNIRDYTSDYKGFTAIGFTNDRFDNIGLAYRYQPDAAPQGSYTVERLLGSFLNVNYSIADKYLFDLAGRLDGSSKFGTENKYAPFWAAGVGWNLHKEAFLASSPVINQLKIRASTGLTGEVSFASYLAKTTYEYYNEWYSSGVGAVNKGYGNEGLKWQRTRNYDLGLELNMFQNRVYIAPRYYYKLTRDLLADIIVPPSLGFASYKANLGEMENRGFEVNLRMDVVRGKKWYVNVYANLVRNVNTIKKISESLKKYNDEIDKQQEQTENLGTPLLRYKEGQSLNTLYGVRSLGIDPENGKEIFVKMNDSLTYDYSVKDIVPIGNSSPKVEGYFGGTAAFRNFSLTLNFYTKLGGELYNQTLIDRVENADPRYNVDQRVLNDRWKQPGDHTFFKDITNRDPTRTTSRFIQRDDVLELRSVNLAYDTPASFTKKLRMQSLRLSVTMNDLWRWSAVQMERGIDYPFARSVTFSIQTRF